MYNLTLDLPNLAQGATVELDGLGIYTNGETHTVSEQEAEAFSRNHPVQSPVYDADHNIVGSTLTSGPTVMEAFNGRNGITVELAASVGESSLSVAKELVGKKVDKK